MNIKIDKVELAQKINALEGLDNETKTQLLELLHDRKKYGLVWEDKPEDVEERLREELPVLIEDKSKAILSEDKDASNHILIEGDNLEALTSLSYTHEGKIDVIYIDPPYNTGNKDFVYNDKFVDTEDEYRHSKWLSFMAKRLKIAKRLLSDEGVIFISIDDNEYAQLKMLCDDATLFGERNFVNNFMWLHGKGKKDTWSRTLQQYIIAYASNKQKLGEWNDKAYTNYEFSNPDNDPKGKWFSGSLSFSEERSNPLHPNYYEIISPTGIKWKRQWQITKQEMNELIKAGDISWGLPPKYDGVPRQKIRPSIIDIIPNNLINECGTTKSAQTELENFNLSLNFEYPKPVALIEKIIYITNKKNDITILDFFAGSGTTLHATMQLNAEDGGHRQCILVTNNENNICEEVTYERNKRVINGYTTPKGEAIEGLHKNTLRYYRTGFVARESSATAKRELMYASADMLCIKNDIYTEQKQFGTLRLRKDVARYFADGDKSMLIIYNPDAIETIVKEIKTLEVKTPIIIYIFSLNDYAMDADFEEVTNKVKLCALPAAILNAYYKVLPKRKRKENTL